MSIFLFILFLLGMLLLFVAAIVFSCFDFILIVLLLYYKYYFLVCIGIPLIILIQSIRFRRTDIFTDDCENFIYQGNIARYIDDPEWRYHMFTENGVRWERESYVNFSRYYPYTYSCIPHVCTSQPRILYSSDNKCKVSIYHTSWQNNILWQKHTFKVIWEKLDHE
jgi:hypothetical protein